MATVLLWCLVAILALGLISTWLLMYQLLRQHGLMLLRIEAVEKNLAGEHHRVADDEPDGLAVGAGVPSFRLPDLSGELVGNEDYRGKRMLLVQWSLNCSFCEQLAPQLADLQEQLRARDVELLLISDGEAGANRRMAQRYGLSCPILLQPTAQIEAFRGLGTPVAYLVDEQGRVAAPLAVGSMDVPELARAALDGVPPSAESPDGHKRLPGQRPLSESRIRRDGLEPGETAPEFTLTGIDGSEVSLASYRGRKVLLVFTDPDCGPCNELTPQLVRLHRRFPDERLSLVMVSRGDLEESRRKFADEHQVEFPVVVQPGWRLSRQYGIFATPTGFLVDEQGVIAEKVAVGADAILALSKAASSRKGAAYGRVRRALAS